MQDTSRGNGCSLISGEQYPEQFPIRGYSRNDSGFKYDQFPSFSRIVEFFWLTLPLLTPSVLNTRYNVLLFSPWVLQLLLLSPASRKCGHSSSMELDLEVTTIM